MSCCTSGNQKTDQFSCYLLPLKSDEGKVLRLIIFRLVHRPNYLKHNCVNVDIISIIVCYEGSKVYFTQIPPLRCQTAQNECECLQLYNPGGNIVFFASKVACLSICLLLLTSVGSFPTYILPCLTFTVARLICICATP